MADGEVSEALLPASLGYRISNMDYRTHLNLLDINVTDQSPVRQLLVNFSHEINKLSCEALTLPCLICVTNV